MTNAEIRDRIYQKANWLLENDISSVINSMTDDERQEYLDKLRVIVTCKCQSSARYACDDISDLCYQSAKRLATAQVIQHDYHYCDRMRFVRLYGVAA